MTRTRVDLDLSRRWLARHREYTTKATITPLQDDGEVEITIPAGGGRTVRMRLSPAAARRLANKLAKAADALEKETM